MEPSGAEHALADPDFDPTSAGVTQYAFATQAGSKNSLAGKLGITCTFCHTIAETRATPFHNYDPSGTPYTPNPGVKARAAMLPSNLAELVAVPDSASRTLGFAIGAGAYRVSPAALVTPERFGPPALRASLGRARLLPERHLRHSHRVSDQRLCRIDPQGQLQRALRARRDVRNVSRRHQPDDDPQRARTLGRRISDRADVLRVGEQPLRGPEGQFEFRSRVQARLPDLPTCSRTSGNRGPRRRSSTLTDRSRPLAGKPALTSPERPVYYSHHFVGGNTYSTRLGWGRDRRRRRQLHVSGAVEVQLLVGRSEEPLPQTLTGRTRRRRARRRNTHAWRGTACATP